MEDICWVFTIYSLKMCCPIVETSDMPVFLGYCEGWGDPHYKTFDGLFYSFQGNCTYVLMEEVTTWHKLKIYIDNVHCAPEEEVSCPRAIIVSYNEQVITMKNHNLIGAAKLEVRAVTVLTCLTVECCGLGFLITAI